ncbi:MAG: enoyl-CoA hydratase/isomerase family protein [Actinomycetes bacterium]
MTAEDLGGGVRLVLEPPVATVELTRPDRLNAQTPATWTALAEAGRRLDGTIRVAVLRGAGRAFSAGLDRAMFTPAGVPGEPSLLELAALGDDELESVIAGFQEGFTWWRRPDLVSIAAVQGHAIGAGFQLALSTDLRVLADDAALSMRETTLGLVPDLTGTATLVATLGYARALEITATGRTVSAGEAERLGLAQLVVTRDALDDAVADLVAALLAAPRDALVETKALLLGAVDRRYDEQRAAERAAQVRLLRDLAASVVQPDHG